MGEWTRTSKKAHGGDGVGWGGGWLQGETWPFSALKGGFPTGQDVACGMDQGLLNGG